MRLFVRITWAHHLPCHTNGTWRYLWVFAKTTIAPAASADCSSDTNVWLLANFLKHNSHKIGLLQKSPLHRTISSFILHDFLSLFSDLLISEPPLTLSFLVGRIRNKSLFVRLSLCRCLNFKPLTQVMRTEWHTNSVGRRDHLSHPDLNVN